MSLPTPPSQFFFCATQEKFHYGSRSLLQEAHTAQQPDGSAELVLCHITPASCQWRHPRPCPRSDHASHPGRGANDAKKHMLAGIVLTRRVPPLLCLWGVCYACILAREPRCAASRKKSSTARLFTIQSQSFHPFFLFPSRLFLF